jgi:hypothetical protein
VKLEPTSPLTFNGNRDIPGTAIYNHYCGSYATPPPSHIQQTPAVPRSPASQPHGPNLALYNGVWLPEDGYDYDYDDPMMPVRWVPGKRSSEHSDCVASKEEGVWQPADGYKWLNDVRGDYRVAWIPFSHAKGPNVIATETPGEWRPEDGYIWRNRNEIRADTDYLVVEDHKVADALRAASIVVRLPEQLDNISEFWGFKEYDYGRVTAALKILASGWIVDMPLAADRRQREVLLDHATKELKWMMKDTLSTIVEQMLDDMKKLTPYKWNPFGAEQRELIAHLKMDTYALRSRGENEIDSEASFTRIRSGSQRSALRYNSGQALGQLLEINSRRRWAD